MFLAVAREVFVPLFFYTGEVFFLFGLVVICLVSHIVFCVMKIGHVLPDLFAVAYTFPLA